MDRARKKSSHFFARSAPQEKRQNSGLTDKKSEPTDKKVDLNGQKSYPNGTKIVRWFHYFCPLVKFWFLVQAGTFFAAFLGGPRHFFSGHLPGTRGNHIIAKKLIAFCWKLIAFRNGIDPYGSFFPNARIFLKLRWELNDGLLDVF